MIILFKKSVMNHAYLFADDDETLDEAEETDDEEKEDPEEEEF